MNSLIVIVLSYRSILLKEKELSSVLSTLRGANKNRMLKEMAEALRVNTFSLLKAKGSKCLKINKIKIIYTISTAKVSLAKITQI